MVLEQEVISGRLYLFELFVEFFMDGDYDILEAFALRFFCADLCSSIYGKSIQLAVCK